MNAIKTWWNTHDVMLGRIFPLVVLCLTVLVLFIIFGIPNLITIKQQWEWGDVKLKSSDSQMALMAFKGFDHRGAKFTLKLNDPDFVPCSLRFKIKPDGASGLTVNEEWLKKIEHRLRLPIGTHNAKIVGMQADGVDGSIMYDVYVDSLAETESLPFFIALVKVPPIVSPSLRESLLGDATKSGFTGTIAVWRGAQTATASSSHVHLESWLKTWTFDYVVKFKPDFRFRWQGE
jgi:hypothetical protein